jgi:hypothetical protein
MLYSFLRNRQTSYAAALLITQLEELSFLPPVFDVGKPDIFLIREH